MLGELKLLLDPLALLSLVVVLGILYNIYRRKSIWGNLVVLIMLLLMASPVIVNPVVNYFESIVALDECRSETSLPIVVLGGGVNGQATSASDVQHLHPASMLRVIEGVRLASFGHSSLMIFSGGVNESVVESEVMANLAMLLGISKSQILHDTESKNTFENAKQVKTLLDENNLGNSVRLVTSAVHMLRASQTFTHLGMQVCPASTHYQGLIVSNPLAVVPQTSVLVKASSLLHELIGLAYYSLTGKL